MGSYCKARSKNAFNVAVSSVALSCGKVADITLSPFTCTLARFVHTNRNIINLSVINYIIFLFIILKFDII